MIEIKILSIEEIKEKINYLYKYLPKEYLDRSSKFKFEECKLLDLGSSYFKYKYIKEDIYYNEFGKPLCNNLYFNISHSHNYVIFAKNNKKIGIDIELIKDKLKEELINYTMNEEEKINIKNNADFIKYWTKKESIIKCEGKTIANIKNALMNNKYNIYTIRYLNYYISLAYDGDKEKIILSKELIKI